VSEEGVVAYVALGSNLGDRSAYLDFARREIAALPACTLLDASTVEETAPLGPPGQPPYLNQMLAVRTSLAPGALLEALLEIERRAGRERGERWSARTLDCDIVRFGEETIDLPHLRVPHPELANRDFWQRELAELEARS
jgi:2-amino-4-hydroxy-6-hydroxymethyldihydropteridine diphosphokinase